MSYYYRTCPRCGAHLDPGEVCDCLDIEAQLLIDHVKNAHAGDANTSVGRAEHVDSTVSTSYDTRNFRRLQGGFSK